MGVVENIVNVEHLLTNKLVRQNLQQLEISNNYAWQRYIK